MAYAQWATITIEPTGMDASVQNATLNWGKFYKCPNKDEEVEASAIDKMVIKSGSSGQICTCGRENASSGTEGSFDLYDGDIHIGNYYWDCPWGSKTNKSVWTPVEVKGYVTQVTGGSLDSGALGDITIQCVKI